MNTLANMYIGIMTGTSLDGLDAVLVSFAGDNPSLVAAVALEYPLVLKQDMLNLQQGSSGGQLDELHLSKVSSIALAKLHVQAVKQLLQQAQVPAEYICAIGAHGQTVRHVPNGGEYSYTVQLLDAAHVVEHTQITVVTDFRSRDIAAGGQGAPLVPAFHAALCKPLCTSLGKPLVICNIGGFANISILSDTDVVGFDTGPGNVLMDGWIERHLAQPYDHHGAWAASAAVDFDLLKHLMQHAYFDAPLPKSTGREMFNLSCLDQELVGFKHLAPASVQATLNAFTVHTIAQAINDHVPHCAAVYVCGGGALNLTLMRSLQQLLNCPVHDSHQIGVPPQHMEALAFAWLAKRTMEGLPSNVPQVTGAKGLRVLGAIYPR